MKKQGTQNFENHAQVIPAFHFFALPVLLINVIWRLVLLKDGISFDSVIVAVLAIALLILALSARNFALRVQDRIIRLEMELRLEKLLFGDQRARIGEFTVDQLIALRFADDEELPVLARQVLDEKLTDRKTIKRRIKNWRPDYMRA